ncbi:MAG: low molecular weight phosphatase family protein [Alphaproteobacteria bacterium]|nr:low molecular weight phosphatase family protein [Alphaproteobacteria bacterium]
MTTASKTIKSVLFVCNQNAVRSPMAEALAIRHSKRRLFVESAGLIAGALDPFTVSALQEEGIDISNHKALTLQDVKLDAFDLVIALTPEAKDRLEKAIGDKGVALEYWATPDPADSEGNRNQIMDSYRLVRDHLECRIADRFPF